jgi:hypothetical protein
MPSSLANRFSSLYSGCSPCRRPLRRTSTCRGQRRQVEKIGGCGSWRLWLAWTQSSLQKAQLWSCWTRIRPHLDFVHLALAGGRLGLGRVSALRHMHQLRSRLHNAKGLREGEARGERQGGLSEQATGRQRANGRQMAWHAALHCIIGEAIYGCDSCMSGSRKGREEKHGHEQRQTNS